MRVASIEFYLLHLLCLFPLGAMFPGGLQSDTERHRPRAKVPLPGGCGRVSSYSGRLCQGIAMSSQPDWMASLKSFYPPPAPPKYYNYGIRSADKTGDS